MTGQTISPTDSSLPVLWGPDGQPISMEGALVAPNALNFANVLKLPGHLYSFRWDEAMKDNPQNALAMKRDCFYLSLLQERWAPTINLEWNVEVDNEDDPQQKLVKDTMGRIWRDTPDKSNLIAWQLQAEWFGRSGSQIVWGKQETGMQGAIFHEPVHGDSIQFTWDNIPVVLVSWFTAQKYLATDPGCVVSGSDRGAYGIKLNTPERRRRFIIHKHSREASDFFEGEMSGGVHGVGLRHYVYWSGWMRTEILTWMLSFMQTTGMMDLLIFNYADGNAASLKAQTDNAKKVSGKLVLLVPRDPKERFPAVEQLSMNTAGITVLKDLVTNYYDKNIERLIVGQSMSSGGGEGKGMEGSGRADFAKDTKYQLVKTGSMRIGETISRDYLTPAKQLNFPWADFPVRLVPVLKDPADEKKAQDGIALVSVGVEVEEAELRRAAGYRDPRPGSKTVGKKPDPLLAAQPGQTPANGEEKTGEEKGGKVDSDFYERLGRLETAILYRAAQPPWPGAEFDETSHRWVSGKAKEEPAKPPARAKEEPAKPTRTAKPAEDHSGKAKGLAKTIQSYGPKAVAMAKAAGQKAHELSYRALAFYMESGISPTDIWEPGDETNLFSNRASTEASAIALGFPLSGPVVKAISTIFGYAVAKLKQFISEKGAKGDKPIGYGQDFEPELYEGGPRPEELAFWKEIARELLIAMGLDIPQEIIDAWIDGQAEEKHEVSKDDTATDFEGEHTEYRATEPPFTGAVSDLAAHPVKSIADEVEEGVRKAVGSLPAPVVNLPAPVVTITLPAKSTVVKTTEVLRGADGTIVGTKTTEREE